MKKLLSATISTMLCIMAVAAESGKKHFFDRFELPLKRTIWVKYDAPAGAWSKVEKQLAFGTRWRLRYSAGSEAIKKLEVINPQGKTIQVDTKCKGGIWVPTPTAGEYTLKLSGVAGTKPVTFVTDTYDVEIPSTPIWKSTPMPSWDTTKCRVEANPEGGAILTPNDKSSYISATLRGLKPNQAYKIELETVSDESQTVTLRCSWKEKGRRFRSSNSKNTEMIPGKSQVITLLVQPKADPFYVSITFAKPLKLKYFSFSDVKGELPKQRMIGNSKAFFEPRNAKPDPKVEYSTPVVFRRPIRMTYNDSIPQKHELIDASHTFTTPGEYAIWYFTVHNPVGSRRIGGAKVTDLKLNGGEAVIAAKDIALNAITFDDYPSSSCNYMNIPERILPLSGQYAADETTYNRIFWFQSKIAANQKPGVYSGNITIDCGEKSISLPISLRVLPFKLEEPANMFWATYSNAYVNLKRNYPMPVYERYLRDMTDYGMNGIHFNNGMSLDPAMSKIQTARKKIGMNGPLIVAGIQAERRAAEEAGYERVTKLRYKKNGVEKFWFEFPELREGFKNVLRRYDALIKKYGAPGYNDWYYLGHDEAHLHKDTFASAIWQFRLCKEAGFKSVATIYPPERVDDIGEHIDISNNMFIGTNADSHRRLTEIGKRKNVKYIYLGGGSYRGQEGGLMPNRLLAGFLSYKLGVIGHLAYTFQEPGYPVDHFQSGKKYLLAYAASRKPKAGEKVNIFTIGYEGLREGITDYKYLYTLKCAIERAKKAGRTESAADAEKMMKELIDSIPYASESLAGSNGITSKQKFNNTTADNLRMLIADAIMKLEAK